MSTPWLPPLQGCGLAGSRCAEAALSPPLWNLGSRQCLLDNSPGGPRGTSHSPCPDTASPPSPPAASPFLPCCPLGLRCWHSHQILALSPSSQAALGTGCGVGWGGGSLATWRFLQDQRAREGEAGPSLLLRFEWSFWLRLWPPTGARPGSLGGLPPRPRGPAAPEVLTASRGPSLASQGIASVKQNLELPELKLLRYY